MLTTIKSYLFPVLLGLVIALGIICYLLDKKLSKMLEERDDYKELYENNNQIIQTYKDENGKNHSISKPIFIESEKIFKQVLEQERLLKELNTKLKRIEAYRITGTNSEFHFKTFIRDSTINDTITIKTFNQEDSNGYFSFKGQIEGDYVVANLSAPDTIIAGYSKCKSCKRPDKFLFFRYGPKPLQVEMVNKNPFVKITYQKEIILKK